MIPLNPIDYFWTLLKASLFSTGGMGNLPMIHSEFIARGWATERQFAESLMIGQVSPGPNGLWVISMGYLTYGWKGVLLAVIAINLPPLLILGVEKLYRRVQHHPAVEGFVRGIGLAVIGIFAVVMVGLLRSTNANIGSLFIVLGAMVLGSIRRVPIIFIMILAAGLGILFK